MSGQIFLPPEDAPPFSVSVANVGGGCFGPWETFVVDYSTVELNAVPPPPSQLAASPQPLVVHGVRRSMTTTDGTFELP